MYLKTLETVGFKSFANPTRLDFDPGMTAIVGPNGCGKSNVLDAIRWVIGEQSAKILRGTKMEDFIFSGTDVLKPLGMAEVSITFADCESTLGSEYNEVTVTRRVYRSGEGEYFMNKVPCRLKDIQRLFMDTGIGTTSYSIMEQGRIDQILSSRPEDRREIFEEASGITKFKTDKNEALRKLEQTEANLLRLTDVIAEVKRQIGSLERQAGKARRYKAAFEELRKLDVFATKNKLQSFDEELTQVRSQLASLSEQVEAARVDVEAIEERNGAIRRQMAEYELRIDDLMQARNEASARLDRTRDNIEMNKARIADSKSFVNQEAAELEKMDAHLNHQKEALTRLTADIAAAKNSLAEAEKRRDEKTALLAAHEDAAENTRKLVENLQNESVELENSCTNLQNDLIRLDSSKRADAVRRERLEAEKTELETQLAGQLEQDESIRNTLAEIESEFSACAGELENLEKKSAADQAGLAAERERTAALQAGVSARKAEIALLSANNPEELPKAAAVLLSQSNAPESAVQSVIGSLGGLLDVETGYHRAVEAVLHDKLDSVVARNADAAAALLSAIEQTRKGSIRIIACDGEANKVALSLNGPGTCLLDRVKAPDAMAGILARLLGNVHVVESLSNVPSPIPPDLIFVTLGGAIASGTAEFEFWSPETSQATPLTARKQLTDARLALAGLENSLEQNIAGAQVIAQEIASLANAIAAGRSKTQEIRQRIASLSGERQVVNRQSQQTKTRIETVTWELESLSKEDKSFGERKQEIVRVIGETENRRREVRGSIETRTRELRDMDRERASLSSDAIEARHRCTELEQRLRFMDDQAEPMNRRLAEAGDALRVRINGQSARIESISQLESTVEEASARIADLEQQAKDIIANLEEVRKERHSREAELAQSDRDVASKRAMSDDLKDRKSKIEIRLAECNLKRQNMLDKLGSDYGITLEQACQEPEPEWEEGKRPEPEWIDGRVAELKAKVDAMGPVNLTAIEEHQELADRYEFLNKQQTDLVEARQKLIAMINKINKTTSEMFAKTFDLVNKNFDMMFAKLFNGGSAKLVLVNEEDILESGIEIIARPPGKKLQSVSLLSGGERTLTAVSLLFAIYMVKPSPFCVLDELDAPLDESNIGRFVNILTSFMDKSQFLIITHNQQTIATADAIYGVTMEEKGVSRTVSLKFDSDKPVAGKAAFVVQPVAQTIQQ